MVLNAHSHLVISPLSSIYCDQNIAATELATGANISYRYNGFASVSACNKCLLKCFYSGWSLGELKIARTTAVSTITH